MNNMWNHMMGWPFYAMNGRGMQGPSTGGIQEPVTGGAHEPMMGNMPGYGNWGSGFGSGSCPGYEQWKPPMKDTECRAILRCIQRCMKDYNDYKPCEEMIASCEPTTGGYEIGPIAGYGWGQHIPSWPITD